ncbi:MAG: PIN domain nuclease, partial [Treponema sp.]|nr:PIN domain nuclease [Treponema sp.]
SNIWIEFFNKKNYFDSVSSLLVNNEVYINKIILAELIPSAKVKNEKVFIECLHGIELLELSIDWDEIIEIQYHCIKNGINKLGLVDIIIAQNAGQNNMGIFTIDRNMMLLCNLIGVECRNS